MATEQMSIDDLATTTSEQAPAAAAPTATAAAPTKKAAVKKPAAAKKVAAKKPAASKKPATVKKAAPKKATAPKAAAKKTTVKKAAIKKTTVKKAAAKKATAKKTATKAAKTARPEFAAKAQQAGRNAFLAGLGFYGKAFDQAQEQFSTLQSQLEARRNKASELYSELVKRGEKVEANAKDAIELPSIKLESLTDRKKLDDGLKKAKSRFNALKESARFKRAA